MIKTEEEIKLSKRSGEIATAALSFLISAISAGVSPKSLDRALGIFLNQAGASSAFLNYNDYPARYCISIDHVALHGLPKDIDLSGGELISVDLGVNYQGLITDCARSFIYNYNQQRDQSVMQMILTAETALRGVVDKIKDGTKVSEISKLIESTIKVAGYSVVEGFDGHGVGYSLHEDPSIPNQLLGGDDFVIRSNMTLAIEPLLCQGSGSLILDKDNNSLKMKDGGLSAHCEKTILITQQGAVDLTPWPWSRYPALSEQERQLCI